MRDPEKAPLRSSATRYQPLSDPAYTVVDCYGSPIKVGDRIIYAQRSGNQATLVEAEVLELGTTNHAWNDTRIPAAKVKVYFEDGKDALRFSTRPSLITEGLKRARVLAAAQRPEED